jgi:hypothetical protein
MAEALQEALRHLVVDPRRLTENKRAMLTAHVDSRFARRLKELTTRGGVVLTRLLTPRT